MLFVLTGGRYTPLYRYINLVLHSKKPGRFHSPIQSQTDATVLQNSFEIVRLVMSTTRLKGLDPLSAQLSSRPRAAARFTAAAPVD